MILRQLIQTGRRFCECRTQDFVPDSENCLVLIVYSAQDRFFAQAIDADDPEIESAISHYLAESDAIAYLTIRRQLKDSQAELPEPIGREPMDRLTITAATGEMICSSTYLLQAGPTQGSLKLIPRNRSTCRTRNLLEPATESYQERSQQSQEPHLQFG